METDTDLRKYIRATIKRKLQELGPYVDEELTDYIMVLVANKKNVHQMAEDLSLFLGRNSVKFSLWLHGVLERLCSVAVGSSLPTGHGQQLGQAHRQGEELLGPTPSSMYSNLTDPQLSISPTFGHHRSGSVEESVQRVLLSVQPPMGRLQGDGGSRAGPELGEGRGPKAGVTDPRGSGWLPLLPDGTLGRSSSEGPWGVGQPQHGYRRLQDDRPAGAEASRARTDTGTREEVMSRRRGHRAASSVEHLRSDTEVGGPNDAHGFIPRKPPVGGSIRSKLASTVGEEGPVSTRLHQGRRVERESLNRSPRFIVTLEGAPSPLRNLRDDGATDESEVHCSDEEDQDPVGRKRRKVLERCRFWPACESGDECAYHHPTAQCKTFPRCSFGDKCLFVHPKCKYSGQCTRADCPYTHLSKRSLTPSSNPEATWPPDLCRFFPECRKMDCPFYHPKPCRFAARCKRADCYFYHPPGRAQVGKTTKRILNVYRRCRCASGWMCVGVRMCVAAGSKMAELGENVNEVGPAQRMRRKKTASSTGSTSRRR